MRNTNSGVKIILKDARNMLSKYLILLNEAFYVNDEIFDNTFVSNQDKLSLKKALSLKDKLISNWKITIDDFKKLPRAIVRDFTAGGGRHSYNCIFRYNNQFQEPSGLIISVSVPFKSFGFYFYKFLKVNENENRKIISFEPMDKEMEENKEKLTSIIVSNFESFQPFDQELSQFKISKVEIDSMLYYNIDLWNVIFTVNTNMAI